MIVNVIIIIITAMIIIMIMVMTMIMIISINIIMISGLGCLVLEFNTYAIENYSMHLCINAHTFSLLGRL